MIRAWLCALLLAYGATARADETPPAQARENRLITLSSGERSGMYYWFANVLGGVVSAPHGSLACEAAQHCGVADSVLLNLTSHGSLDNLERLRSGQTDTAFAQSNLAYAAHNGQGDFAGRGNDRLRAIASLYPEVLHLVVAADSGIDNIEQLAGKRLAIGAPQSGTLGSAQAVLDAHGIRDYHAQSQSLEASVQRFLDGEADALFFFSAAGNPLVKRLAEEKNIRLLALRGDAVKTLLRGNGYYQAASIPADSYAGQTQAVPGIAVQALWLTSADSDDALIYALTKSLWEGGAAISWQKAALPHGAWEEKNALKGIGIPLHPGAKRYYNEIGKRF